MRINGFQDISSILESFNVGRPFREAPVKQGHNVDSSVSLSSFAQLMKTAQRQTVQGAKEREGRVAELMNQARSGTLKVDVSKLAEKLLSSSVINLGD